MDSLPMDPFFFSSSPLFGAQAAPQLPEEVMELAPLSAHELQEADALFLHSDSAALNQHAHKEQMQLQMQAQADAPLGTGYVPMANLQSSRHASEFDWNGGDFAAVPMPEQPNLQSTHLSLPVPHYDAPSRASSCTEELSSAGSGHSTPSFVAAQPPHPAQLQAQVPMHHAPVHVGHGSLSISLSQPSCDSAPPACLLDQFSVHVPEPVEERSIVKVKRERGKRATATTVKKATAAASRHTLSPSSVASMGGAGYSSESSSPSSAASPLSLARPAPSLEPSNEPHADDDEETKRRKLSRKAELARLARKRKKTRLTDLEAEVRRLEEELARAKRGRLDHSALLAAAEPDQLCKQRMDKAVAGMVAAVESGEAARTAAALSTQVQSPNLTGSDLLSRSNPTTLTPLIDEFVFQYNAQQANCVRHLNDLAEFHMQPPRTMEFVNWIMKQNQNEALTSSLWSSLVHGSLQLSPESREYRELECFRTSLMAQHNFDGEISRALAKLQSLCAKRATQQGKNLNRIRSIFSESQFCVYAAWQQRWSEQQLASEAQETRRAQQQQVAQQQQLLAMMQAQGGNHA